MARDMFAALAPRGSESSVTIPCRFPLFIAISSHSLLARTLHVRARATALHASSVVTHVAALPPTSGDRHHALAPRKYTSHAARIHSTRDCSDTEMRQYRAYQASPPGLSLSLHTPSDHSHSHTKEHTISCNNKVHNIYRTVRPFHPISLSLLPPDFRLYNHIRSLLCSPERILLLAGFMLLSVILRLSCITF